MTSETILNATKTTTVHGQEKLSAAEVTHAAEQFTASPKLKESI